jgi:hypothetical protein
MYCIWVSIFKLRSPCKVLLNFTVAALYSFHGCHYSYRYILYMYTYMYREININACSYTLLKLVFGWVSSVITSARNGNLEVSVYFLEAKQGHTVRKMEMINWYSTYKQLLWGNGGGEVRDNPKPGLKRKQSKHTKLI